MSLNNIASVKEVKLLMIFTVSSVWIDATLERTCRLHSHPGLEMVQLQMIVWIHHTT